MTTVYLIRHGEAKGNVDRTFQGHTDEVLTENGQRQLELLAQRCRAIRFDRVYTSPLCRARETALAANAFSQAPMEEDPALKEINGGIFEGRRFDDLLLEYPEVFQLWREQPHRFQATQGESMEEVYRRMAGAVDRIAAQNMGKSIAVVSHGCALKNYLCYASGLAPHHLQEIPWLDNTSISCVRYEDTGGTRVLFMNDHAHLGELSSLARQIR